MSNLSIPNGIQTGRMLFAGMLMTTTVICALKSISKEKKRGYSVRDCVSSEWYHEHCFMFSLSEFPFEMIFFCRTETIFYQITSILFSAFPHTKEVQNATV